MCGAIRQRAAAVNEPTTPCPPGCPVPPDIHVHYQREPGDYFKLTEPLGCCGREYMRVDEVLFLDQCGWCRSDGRPLPDTITYSRGPAR